MRDVVRLGDPGIDEAWARRRALGGAFVSTWIVATTLAVGAMAAGAVGPVGWIEAVQVRVLGGVSPVMAALPFMVLPFAPLLAQLLPTDVRRPFLLGMQQASSPTSGPRFEPSVEVRRRDLARKVAVATTAMVAGLVALLAGIALAVRESSAPIPPPVIVSYEDAASGRPRTGSVLVTGAVEGRASWLERSTTRGSTVRTRWRTLVPPDAPGPARLVESVVVGTDDANRPRDLVRPSLVGRLSPLDDWTAARLREAGIPVAGTAIKLERSMGDEGDAVDASMPGALLAIFGFVATVVGGALRWKARRNVP